MGVGRGGDEEKREVRGAGVEEGDEVALRHEREQNHRLLRRHLAPAAVGRRRHGCRELLLGFAAFSYLVPPIPMFLIENAVLACRGQPHYARHLGTSVCMIAGFPFSSTP